MRALTITRFGEPDVLQVVESPTPAPSPGKVRIRVHRAGLNFADIAARVGLYPDAPRPPMVVGYEVAGTVDACGSGVELPLGTRVVALCRFGGQATHAVVAAEQVLPLPAAMSFDEAAALPVNYLTAYHVLFHVGHVRPKDRILIHMAAGGVGLAAIQLCRTVPGVELFGTSSASKHAFLKEAGMQHPIDYRTCDYEQEVLRLSGGKKLHLVLDPLGGEDWKKGFRLLQTAGHLVAYGWANMVQDTRRNWLKVGREFARMPLFSPMKLMNVNRTVSGVNLGHMWDVRELMLSHLRALLGLYTQGVIKPHVDRVFPLSEGAAAHRHVQARKNIGKVLFDCT